MTSDLDLDAIEARANAATEGPWDSYTVPGTGRIAGYVAVAISDTEMQIARFEGGFFDAEFIAHARTDVPALVARVRELEAAVERVRALVGDWQSNGNSRELGDPTAETWHKCARQLLRALEGATDE